MVAMPIAAFEIPALEVAEAALAGATSASQT
jgi:hypothetical protein